jgi:hypothetical protein
MRGRACDILALEIQRAAPSLPARFRPQKGLTASWELHRMQVLIVIPLTRQRRFVLAEMADHFDSILLPRIQKVIFSPEWKDGKPKRLPTSEEIDRTPRLVKVLRPEGYEDALHNLVTLETAKREGPRAAAYKAKLGEDAYRLGVSRSTAA